MALALPAQRPTAAPVAAVPSPLRRSSGQALAAPTRRRLERSFGTSLAAVRVHAGVADRQRVTAAGARALAQGSDVFLGKDESADDLPLMGHELDHVLQQRGTRTAPQALGFAPRGGALEAEADRAGAAVAAGQPVAVSGRADGRPQGSWLGDAARAVGSAVSGAASAVAGAVADVAGAAMGFIRDHARQIPGYDLLGLALGRDPITGAAIDRTPAAVLRALIGLWPAGGLLRDALDRHGLIDRVGTWLGRQMASLARIAGGVLGGLERFVRGLGPGDILNPGGVWSRARALVFEPVQRAWNFAAGLAADVLGFIRDAVLVPLARLAAGTRGYPLLRVVLGRDPLSGEAVARTPEALIGGFMTLIGEQERWQQLVESRAVPRAWAWVQTQLGVLGGFVAQIPGLLRQAWQSLSVQDLLNLPGAIGRMTALFGGFISRFVSWAGQAVLQLVQAMFEVLAPGAMPVLQRARSVLGTIFRDPVRFVGNLVRAGIAGFRQFFNNIRTHLVNGLVGWLTGALGGAGLTLPTTWDLRGVLSLVMQILGLTWANVRARLVRATNETVVAALETGFELVVTLVREGPVAAWRQLVEHLGNLRDMVMGQVRDWVARTVVGQAVMRIASMLNPAGAVIQAIIAIYNTVMFVRERLQQIVQVAESFINGIAAIAAGNIGAAADRVEQTMGRLVPVVISFLARLLGLGGIGDTIRNILARVRAPVERSIDRVVAWIVTQARRVGSAAAGAARGAVARVTQWWTARRRFRADDGEHSLYIEGTGARRRLMMASTPAELRTRVQSVNATGTRAANKTNALAILTRLETAMNAAAGTGRAAADAGARIDSLMGELARETGALFTGGAAGASTQPLFGPLSAGGFGSSVGVERLTAAHTAGSEPGVGGGHWATLARRMDGGSTYYVRGHLLNHNLGGTGASWQNLTPLTQATNNRSAVSMLHTFENRVKNEVDRPGAAVNLTVRVTYGRRARTSVVDELKATGDSSDSLIADIIDAERHVPTVVHGVAHRIAADGRRTALVEARINNPVDTNEDSYSLGGRPRVTMNLNREPRGGLRRLVGVTAAVAARIDTERTANAIRDRDDFMARPALGPVLWHQLVSTAGIRVRFR